MQHRVEIRYGEGSLLALSLDLATLALNLCESRSMVCAAGSGSTPVRPSFIALQR